MQEGSLVITLYDFVVERLIWGHAYPWKGDVLTVSAVKPHHNAKGVNLLWFYELPSLPGLCDKRYDGQWNFAELQKPGEVNVEELINECELIGT